MALSCGVFSQEQQKFLLQRIKSHIDNHKLSLPIWSKSYKNIQTGSEDEKSTIFEEISEFIEDTLSILPQWFERTSLIYFCGPDLLRSSR